MEAALSWSDRYEIIKEIKGSSHGRVYLVYDRRLGVRRILKEISGLLSQKEAEELRQHFIGELQIAKELHHPNIPIITDLLVEEGSIRLFMEYVEGESLQVYVEKHGIVGEEVLIEWALQLTDILHYLHGRHPPVIHRDIKPANIICHPSGRLYLLDYGIAGLGYGFSNEQNPRGSPGYAAPEQYEAGGKSDSRTDLYGLGRTLIFCLCGYPEWKEDSVTICSQELLVLLRKCTSPCPEDRYQDVMELQKELYRLKDRGKKRGRVRRKETLLTFIILGMICIAAASCLMRSIYGRMAMEELDCAREKWNQEEILSHYRTALSYAPWREEIYESILEEYVIPNHFTVEAAVELLNVLEDTHALSVLKRQNAEEYASFCYGMGIGYFYYMGGVGGKQEAALWFDRASDSGSSVFDEWKQRRLECYGLISKYYRTFLSYGQDESGESERQSYGVLFSTLQKLRHNSIDPYTDGDERREGSLFEESGTASEEEVLCMIAMEIAMEIRDHAQDFLSEEEITSQLLLEELDQVDISPYLQSEDSSSCLLRLEQVIEDARSSVQMMEGREKKDEK